MKTKTDEPQLGEPSQHFYCAWNLIEVNSELMLAQSGGNVGMRFRVDVRIDPEGDREPPSVSAGQSSQSLQFLKGLYIDRKKLLSNGRLEFLESLAHPTENDPAGVRPDLLQTVQFSPRDHVETTSLLIQ